MLQDIIERIAMLTSWSGSSLHGSGHDLTYENLRFSQLCEGIYYTITFIECIMYNVGVL